MAGVGVLLQRLFPRRVLSLPLTHVVWGERRLQTDPSHLAMANHSLAVLRVFEVQVRELGVGTRCKGLGLRFGHPAAPTSQCPQC